MEQEKLEKALEKVLLQYVVKKHYCCGNECFGREPYKLEDGFTQEELDNKCVECWKEWLEKKGCN